MAEMEVKLGDLINNDNIDMSRLQQLTLLLKTLKEKENIGDEIK
jgi:hypothetical protein